MRNLNKRFALTKTLKVMALSLAVVIIIAATVEFYIEKSPFILFGTKIEEFSVGGLNIEAARLKLEQGLKAKYQGLIQLEIQGKTYTFKPWNLGFSPNYDKALTDAYNWGRQGGLLRRWQERKLKKAIPLEITWQEQTFKKTLTLIGSLYAKPAQAAQLEFSQAENNSPQIRPEQLGSYLDSQKSFQNLLSLVKPANLLKATTPVPLLETTIVPFPCKDDFASWNLTNKIGSYTTYYNPDSNRGNNVELAASLLHNSLLYPYQELSLNQTLGERTPAKGYLPAPTIVEGKLLEQFGGGICQVSSTLYNAVLKANQGEAKAFVILERHPHSLPVDYVPLGQDATLSYGYKDFRFLPKTATPILIKSVAKAGVLEVSIYGNQP